MEDKKVLKLYPLFEDKFLHTFFWISFCVVVASSFSFFVLFLTAFLNGGSVVFHVNHFGEAPIELFLLVIGLGAAPFFFKLFRRELKKHNWRF